MPNVSCIKELRLNICGITFLINSVDSQELTLGDSYKQFVTTSAPDITLKLHSRTTNNFPPLPKCKVFDSGTWSLYRDNFDYIFSFYSPDPGQPLKKLAIIDKDFTSGDIFLNSDSEEAQAEGAFGFPLDEVLMICLLSLGRGLMVHSCAVKYNDSAMLFVGSSGRGKSTIADIWKTQTGTTILNDDRVVLRNEESRVLAFGTPWHGQARLCAQGKAPLEKIFFIKHAKENYLEKISQLEVVSRLITCSFVPFWDKAGMQFSLDFASKLAKNIPSFELGFLPDESILEFLKQ